jgi:hypothetical protein
MHSSPAQLTGLRVQGHLDHAWSAWFDGLTITHEPGGDTLLEGELAD